VPPSCACSWSLIRDVLGSGALGLLLPASLGLSVVVFPPNSSGETRQKAPTFIAAAYSSSSTATRDGRTLCDAANVFGHGTIRLHSQRPEERGFALMYDRLRGIR
jgi:hypothetical protein